MTIQWETPNPLGWNRVDVSALAASAARELGFCPGDPIEPIVEKLGGEIVYGDLTDDESDSGSIRIEPSKFVINIPLNTSPLRDRFTIAHELGHYVLHYLMPNRDLPDGRKIRYLSAQRYGSDQTEYEANWFAAAFLMPSDTFKAEYIQKGGDLLKVAEHFKVSPSAASVRAKSLNLI
ncbi:ImmA/IrrE family metallo-endopeptidase [Stenotrophomonas sp. PS02289]|uniref:ImmA/IrrE family metallo-endopeptidase n=1 Tax=Stenotrophomonas sp. PS02289 TaxID=2991422 RepID=UPI00249A617F|nr:ImmA/IrrE family metallo-endopeptidase [Stenotrophomonas sp. PS02289]